MITIESKIEEEDLKAYLYYHQYFEDAKYLPLRIGISFVLGLICGFFTGETFELFTFIWVTVFCIAVFLFIPMAKIHMYYKDRVRNDRTGTFRSRQVYRFDEEGAQRLFENGEEDAFFSYRDIYRIVERESVFLCYFEKKLCAIIPKRFIKEADYDTLVRMLQKKMGDRFIRKGRKETKGSGEGRQN